MGRIKGTRKVNGVWVVPQRDTVALKKRTSVRQKRTEPLKGDQLTLPAVPSDSQLLLSHLQETILRQREDFAKIMQIKDEMIAMLKEDKALLNSKLAVYDMSKAKAGLFGAQEEQHKVAQDETVPKKPNFPPLFKEYLDMAPKTKWQLVQEEHEETLKREAEEEQRKAKEQVVNG